MECHCQFRTACCVAHRGVAITEMFDIIHRGKNTMELAKFTIG